MSQEITPSDNTAQGDRGLQETNKKSRAIKLPTFIKTTRFILRYRSHPEALEPFLTTLQAEGVLEKYLPGFRRGLTAWLQSHHETEAFHRVDRYLVGGLGAVDLVLFAVLLALGTPDRALFIAFLALAISLPLASCSLFISFLKSEYKETKYGKFHSTCVFLAQLSGIIALVAAFWHVSSAAGIVFLCLVVTLFTSSFIYWRWVSFKMHYLQQQKAATTRNDQATSSHPNTPTTALSQWADDGGRNTP